MLICTVEQIFVLLITSWVYFSLVYVCVHVCSCVLRTILVHIYICCFGSVQEPAFGLEPLERLMGKDPISINPVCVGFFFLLS